MLQPKLKVNGFLSYYHRYKYDFPKNQQIFKNKLFQITRDNIQYLNKVYRSHQPVDIGIYEQKQMSMKQIYSESAVIIDLSDEKRSRSFSTWYSAAKSGLTLVDQTCKIPKKKENDVSKTKIIYRSLWVLKSIHRASSVDMAFGSYNSASDKLFVKCDITTTTVILGTTGNTQGNTTEVLRIFVLN
ncbi:hypothetical protein J3Q64DRAFT_1825253 [Phycomyces blakesleeanus]|uniref:PiggyBac transposable element-derived protein domain-containing protein n=1 Tax=Phycomyces blakesleeanus TaxID=4837 RepID=A0ABR3AMV8_PHYBL